MNQTQKNSFRVLGVDVGGTYVKLGIVNTSGIIEKKYKISTASLFDKGMFIKSLISTLNKIVLEHDIVQIGMGIPGLISKDRKSTLYVPAIPELNQQQIIRLCEENLPKCQIKIENDANAAALGAYYYSEQVTENTFGYITMGTGIGSAAIINGEVFRGGNGNALELGEIISREGRILEKIIGNSGIINLVNLLEKKINQENICKLNAINVEMISEAAENGNKLAVEVLLQVGEILGEGLVSFIKILDITTLYIGGGISPCFDFIKPGVMSVFKQYLDRYYLDSIKLERAEFGNDSGILGAASLFIDQMKDKKF